MFPLCVALLLCCVDKIVVVGLVRQSVKCEFIAPKASAEGACIFSKLVTMERV